MRGAAVMGAGSKVKFIAHGETGLPYTVVTRDGDDCCLCDARGRLLEHVPFELLVLVNGEQQSPRIPEVAACEVSGVAGPPGEAAEVRGPNSAVRCWREVDEMR